MATFQGLMVEIITFICAFGGSLISEVFVMDEVFHKGEKLPDRYRHPGFGWSDW
jgi:hypothetical protein